MNHTKKQDNSENNFDKDEFEQFFDEICKQSNTTDEDAKKKTTRTKKRNATTFFSN